VVFHLLTEGVILSRTVAIDFPSTKSKKLLSVASWRATTDLSYNLSTTLQSISTREPADLAGFCFPKGGSHG
jgi:hypothetical protein